MLMDTKTMLGYLTGFQLDTPRVCFKRFDYRPLFRTILKKKTERTTIFESTVFLKTRHFSRDAALSTRTYFALGR
jgi:hypothetical protein